MQENDDRRQHSDCLCLMLHVTISIANGIKERKLFPPLCLRQISELSSKCSQVHSHNHLKCYCKRKRLCLAQCEIAMAWLGILILQTAV